MTIKSWIRDKLGITAQIELAVVTSGNFYGQLERIINSQGNALSHVIDKVDKLRERINGYEAREPEYIRVGEHHLLSENNEKINACLENIAILSQRTLSLEQLMLLSGEKTNEKI